MAGIMETLFGADGVGGQPGAVGNFLDFATGASAQAAPVQENGQQMLARYGKDLARLPFTLAKLPLDFLSDPNMFLNGRQVDLGAVFSPSYRKDKKQQQKIQEKAEEARAIYHGVRLADDFTKMLQEQQPSQRYSTVQQASSLGMDDAQIESALAKANQQDQARQQAVGMLAPSVGADTAEALLSADPTIAKAATLKARLDANNQKQAEIAARTGRRMMLAERREARLAAQPPAATPEQRLDRELAERGAKAVFDQTAETTGQKASALASTITDPTMGGSLVAQVPTFSARAAKRAAQKFIEEQTPLTSRKNVFRRKKAKQALDQKVEALPQTTGLDSAILNEAPLPTDPAERLAEAEKLGTALLVAGFPPDKAAAELLRRGFTAEELPE